MKWQKDKKDSMFLDMNNTHIQRVNEMFCCAQQKFDPAYVVILGLEFKAFHCEHCGEVFVEPNLPWIKEILFKLLIPFWKGLVRVEDGEAGT